MPCYFVTLRPVDGSSVSDAMCRLGRMAAASALPAYDD